MPVPDPVRRPSPVHLVLGALFAGTALFLVPSLALQGAVLPAILTALFWVGGLVLIWWLLRAEERLTANALERERQETALHQRMTEFGVEAFVIVDDSGRVTYASANVGRVVGVAMDRLGEEGALLDPVHPEDRRRALRALSQVRRESGATASLELRGWHPDGTQRFLGVRAVNLSDQPEIGGTLIGLRDVTPRRSMETEIQHLAYYDALTGLANQRFFHEQGGHALRNARRNGEALALLFIDLDRFKEVNDVLGHRNGDDLLQQVADALRNALRDTDLTARMGGDEFAVILPDVKSEEAAARVAHRVLAALPGAVPVDGHEVPVAASIGVAMFPEDGEDVSGLLKVAQDSLNRAKAEEVGVRFGRPELQAAVATELRLEKEMRKALEQHEFQLHYQPVFDLKSGGVAGAEALSRWRHFTRGMVAAAEFIRVAERTGMIRSLDRWAIAGALTQRCALLERGWQGWVAVNLSPSSVSDPGLPAYVQQVLAESDAEPGSLVLELPEAAVLRDAPAAADFMWELKNAGAAIAIDDFSGTSFRHLQRLPVDVLKLDARFTDGIGAEDGGNGQEGLVEGAIAIARGIRARVLAKGVERESQLRWLSDAGCDYLQGYLTGEPVPADDLRTDPDPRAIHGD